MIRDILISRITRVQDQLQNGNKSQQALKQVTGDSDSVDISEQVNHLNSLTQGPLPETDPAKLSAIQTAIAQGKYQIDYEKLAQTLILFND